MILRFILYAFGFYILYKVIFELVIPIFRVTRKVRQQFSDMQQHMNDQMNNSQQNYTSSQQYSNPSSPTPPGQNKTAKSGDYIDFEEVK